MVELNFIYGTRDFKKHEEKRRLSFECAIRLMKAYNNCKELTLTKFTIEGLN